VTEAERRAALEQVASEVRTCTRCRLHEGRTEAVPGEGHPSTEVLLVGEAPGLNEDRQGRPFVGAAGGFLTELLGTVGWSRDEVFITNVVKCRPPQNRDPEPDEIAACAPYLRRQVEILDPALVITLGRHSMGRFMPGARIGQVHGTTASPPAETGAPDALVFAMYHPAAALHQGSLRQTLLDDMTGAPAALLEARRRREASRVAVRTGEAAEAASAPDASEAPFAEGGLEAEPPVQVPGLGAEGTPAGPAGLAPAGMEPVVAAEAAHGAADALDMTAEASVGQPIEPEPAAPEMPAATEADVSSAPMPALAAPTPEMPPETPAPAASAGPALVDVDPVLPPALVPGADAPATDQMTLF
jgi:uracil-DNA glycosylase